MRCCFIEFTPGPETRWLWPDAEVGEALKARAEEIARSHTTGAVPLVQVRLMPEWEPTVVPPNTVDDDEKAEEKHE